MDLPVEAKPYFSECKLFLSAQCSGDLYGESR